jgi:hypothetical protein
LSQGILGDELFALQFLDTILEFSDLGFVDLDERRRNCWSCAGSTSGLWFFRTGDPHNQNHEYGEAGNEPGLDVLRQETRWLWCLIFDSLIHG